eukprot:PhF_6_TR17573/c1_g1_i1/m.26735
MANEPVVGGATEWQSGAFECMSDFTGCIDVCLCAPCMIGRQWMAAEGQVNTSNFPCCIGAMCFGPCAVTATRQKIRTRFAIEGSLVSDVLCGFCCAACATCQHSRELTKRNMWPGGCIQQAPPAG